MSIEVRIMHVGTGTELARIEIENVDTDKDEFGTYSIKFATDRCGAVGLHKRSLYAFPRLKYNVLALLLQALNTLEPDELELRHGTNSSDLGRRFRGIGKKVQGWKD